MPDVPISTTATPAPLPAQASASPLNTGKRDSFITQNSGAAPPSGILVVHGTPPSGPGSGPGWLHHYGLAHIPDRRVSVYGDALTILLWAALVLPCLAVTFRRLHDTGRSGFWALVLLLPFGLGRLFFFYLTLSESKTENNKYRGNTPVQASAPPEQEQAAQPFTPFYLYWLISLRKLTTTEGRASQSGILVLLSSLPLPVPAAGVQHGGLRQHSPASVFFPFP